MIAPTSLWSSPRQLGNSRLFLFSVFADIEGVLVTYTFFMMAGQATFHTFVTYLCLQLWAILVNCFACFCCQVVCHFLGSQGAVLHLVEDDDELCIYLYATLNCLTVA